MRTVLVIGLCVAALAQPRDVRTQMADLLRYTGIENPEPGDVARLAELWMRAQQTDLAREDRRLAYREMYILYAKLHGRDLTARPQAADGLSQVVMTTLDGGGRMDLTLPEPRGKPSGTYLSVEKRGTGPVPLLLISDLGVDGRNLYASFVERQARAYTMHIVTLPYAGAARPLPWPEKLDYAARPWLSAIERELLALVDAPRMNGITVVGTSGGGYFAARLALLRPKRIRKAVLVGAQVNVTTRALADLDAPASPAERIERVKAVAPTPQLFPAAPVPMADELKRLVADPSSTHPTARNWMAFAVKDTAVSRAWTFDALSRGFFVPSLEYGWELSSTDLTAAMEHLAVPTLAMGSWPDDGAPAFPPNVSQWEELKLRYPTIPLTVVAFDETRTYISADAPAEFDRALADFLTGRPVHGKIGYSLPRASPRASVMQAVGGAEIEIRYGRPAVSGRKIWGEIVPNGRVWRAGANEATTFTCNRDVTIEGRALPAGTYTLFAIPNDAEWTMVLNRVPRQWGAFDYDAAVDALRVAAKPVDAPHEEYLRYTIEPAGSNAAVVSLAWEKRAVTFRVEVSP